MPESSQVFLAIDLGASGGRVVAGLFDGQQLSLEEVYRFDNGGIHAAHHMHWPLMSLWQHVTRGLRAAGKLYPDQIASVGVDTWGVDFALLGRGNTLLGNPRHYRDPHTEGVMEEAFRRVPREEGGFRAPGWTPYVAAGACLFLASPLAAYVTGAAVAVHGGGEPPPFLAAAAPQ